MELLKKLRAILTAREIKRFAWLLIAFLIMGLFEVIGIASIMPFMQLVAQPDAVERNEWLRWAYEGLGFQEPQAFLFAVGVLVMVLLATANIITVLVTWLEQRYVWGTAHAIAVRLMRTYIYQPYEFFLLNNSSDLAKQILAEVKALASSALLPLVQSFARFFVSLIIFSLLVLVDPKLAITVFAVLGSVYALIYFSIRRYLSKLGKVRLSANQMRFKMANEAFGSIKAVKTKGCEDFFVSRFSTFSERFSSVTPKYHVTMVTPVYFVQTLAFGGLLLVVLYLLAVKQSLENVIPILSLYALAGYRLIPSLQGLFKSVSSLPYSQPIVEAIHDDLELAKSAMKPPEPGDTRGLRFEKEITIRNLSFRYRGLDESVLHGINLTIPKNSSVALVGPTGSGKTTMVDIIMGLLQPQEGAVQVDGVPVTLENIRQWQAITGYVPQEAFLYDDTITHNIAFGLDQQSVDFERVQQVAKMANIHSFIINELPDGYDTIVGERGVRLSGGQRQRIGLARAMYHNPEVLILDEATSALDGITEEAVMQAIAQMGRQVTIIMIAHRLTTVKDCDHIYLLDRGRVVAAGTYDDLMEESSVFRGMAKVAT